MAEAKTSKETKTMRTQIKIALASLLALIFAMSAASAASASFGLEPGSVDGTVYGEGGEFYAQAAGHPASVTTKFKLNSVLDSEPGEDFGLPIADEANLRNVTVEAPPGLIGNPTASPRCALADFIGEGVSFSSDCSDAAQI